MLSGSVQIPEKKYYDSQQEKTDGFPDEFVVRLLARQKILKRRICVLPQEKSSTDGLWKRACPTNSRADSDLLWCLRSFKVTTEHYKREQSKLKLSTYLHKLKRRILCLVVHMDDYLYVESSNTASDFEVSLNKQLQIGSAKSKYTTNMKACWVMYEAKDVMVNLCKNLEHIKPLNNSLPSKAKAVSRVRQ